MSAFYLYALYALHTAYALYLRLKSFKKRLVAPPPQQLTAPRRRIPKHLAILFAIDNTVSVEAARETLTQSVVNAVEWCRTLGIKKLTVYEEHDTLTKCTQELCERLPVLEHEGDSSESEVDYPLTPPPSDHSDSRPISPANTPQHYAPVTKLRISEKVSQKYVEQQKLHKRRPLSQKTSGTATKGDLLLCMISVDASKPTIAAVTTALAERERMRLASTPAAGTATPFKLSVADLDQLLEDEDGLSSPDFMIIHPLDTSYSSPAPPELHGFPPWHIRLTEIYQNYPRDSPAQPLFNWRRSSRPIPLDEYGFREALDEYASAEMRFGK